jgi:hypothetical protein
LIIGRAVRSTRSAQRVLPAAKVSAADSQAPIRFSQQMIIETILKSAIIGTVKLGFLEKSQ